MSSDRIDGELAARSVELNVQLDAQGNPVLPDPQNPRPGGGAVRQITPEQTAEGERGRVEAEAEGGATGAELPSGPVDVGVGTPDIDEVNRVSRVMSGRQNIGDRPRRGEESTSEAVRDRKRAPVDLNRAGVAGTGKEIERIRQLASGEIKGLTRVPMIDAALEAINIVSMAGGAGMADALKQLGMEPGLADTIGEVAGLVGGLTAGPLGATPVGLAFAGKAARVDRAAKGALRTSEAVADLGRGGRVGTAGTEAELRAAAGLSDAPLTRASMGFRKELMGEGWAILSASKADLSAEENAARTAQLAADLRTRGLEAVPVAGRYGGVAEDSFFVRGVAPEDALALGAKYEQESVLTPQGLAYTADRTVTPADMGRTDFSPGQVDNASTVRVGGPMSPAQDVTFSVPPTAFGAERVPLQTAATAAGALTGAALLAPQPGDELLTPEARQDVQQARLGLSAFGRPLPHLFSKLRQLIATKMPVSAKVADVEGLIRGGGIKTDEVKWSAIDDMLTVRGSDATITREEVLKYLDTEGKVEVREIVRGGSNEFRGEEFTGMGGRAPKHERYTLPGDKTNYTELEITWAPQMRQVEELPALPAPERSMRAFDAWLRTNRIEAPTSVVSRAGTRRNALARATLYERFLHETANPKPPEAPGVEQLYQSGHFPEPNILAHVRTTDRTDIQGRKVLLVEEVQSDMHQQARKAGGYRPKPEDTASRVNLEEGIGTVTQQSGERPYEAPFAKTWPELAMKRVLAWAAEHGYDAVAWTTGTQQGERYDLSRHVRTLELREYRNTAVYGPRFELNGVTPEGTKFHVTRVDDPAQLEPFIGKEALTKLMALPSSDDIPELRRATRPEFSFRALKLDQDTVLGGEGMREFYDKMLPRTVENLGKRWGAKTGKVDLGEPLFSPADAIDGYDRTNVDVLSHGERSRIRDILSDIGRGEDAGLAIQNRTNPGRLRDDLLEELDVQREAVEPGPTVHGIDVTDAMKKAVLGEGQPLFSIGGGLVGTASSLFESGQDTQQAGIPANLPLLHLPGKLAQVQPGKNRLWNALASRGSALIFQGADSQRRFTQRMLAELQSLGHDTAALEPHMPQLYQAATEEFKDTLKGARLTRTRELSQYAYEGTKYPDWYGTQQELVDVFGKDARAVAGIIAATSAHTPISMFPRSHTENISSALRAYEYWKTGQLSKINSDNFLPAHVQNIKRAIAGEPLSGNKVFSFDGNIWGDERPVTIDGQMARLIYGADFEVNKLNDARYALAAQVVADFGKEELGTTPRFAQQALWVGRKILQDEDFGVAGLHDVIRAHLDRNPRLNAFVQRNGLGDDFEGAGTLAQILTGIVTLGTQLGDTSEDTVNEYLAGMGGLQNPRAAKALAAAARLLRRKTPALKVEVPSAAEAERFEGLDPNVLQIGDSGKLLSINWESMQQSPDAIRDTVLRLKEYYDVEGVHVASRGVVKDVDEALLAAHLRELGFDAEAVMARRAGEAANSTEVWAAADVLKAAIIRLNDMSDTRRALVKGSAEHAASTQEFQLQMGVAGALVRQLDGMGEEAGRALRAFQQAGEELGVARSQRDFLRQAADLQSKGMIANPEMLPDLWNRLPDTEAKGTFLRLLAKHGYDFLVDAFFNSMLGIKANIANLIGNSTMTAHGPITRFMAASVPGSETDWRQGVAMLNGMGAALGEALWAAGKGFLKGESSFGGSVKAPNTGKPISGDRVRETLAAAGVGLNPILAKGIDALGIMAGAGSRGLIAADDFFKTLNYSASIYEQGTQAVLSGRIKAKELRKFLSDPPDYAVDVARQYAAYVTFTDPLSGDLAAAGRLARNPIVMPFVPFFRIAANMAKVQFEHLPLLNFAVQRTRTAMLSGGPAEEIAGAQLAIGTSAMAFGMWLWMNGHITGRGPSDPRLRRQLQDETGWQPHARVFYREDGTKDYLAINRLDPFVQPFLLAADIGDIYSEMMAGDIGDVNWENADELAVAGVLGFMENWTSRSWMSGFREATEAMTMKDAAQAEKLGRFFRRQAAAQGAAMLGVGAIGAEVGKAMDPTLRETYDLLDEFYERIPWGRRLEGDKRVQQAFGLPERTLYPRRKINGDPILRMPALGPDWASPFPYTKGQPQPASRALINNRVFVPEPPKSIEGAMPSSLGVEQPGKGVQLTGKQRDRIWVLRGNELKVDTRTLETGLRALGFEGELPAGKMGMWDFLNALVETPGFKRLPGGAPDSGQATVLKHITSSFETAAEKKLMIEDKELRDKIILKKLDRIERQAGPEARQQAEGVLQGIDIDKLVESVGR